MDYATNQGTNFTGPFRLEVIGFSVGDPDNITRFPEADIPLYNTDFADGFVVCIENKTVKLSVKCQVSTSLVFAVRTKVK